MTQITLPVDYRLVDASAIDTSRSRLLPRIASEKGGWGKSAVLEAEDAAFLVEAMGERFGADAVSAPGFGRATVALDSERLLTAADHILAAASQHVYAKPLDDYLDGTEDRYGADGVPDQYADMFGIPVETTAADVAAWRAGRPLVVGDVERLYRDMRRFDLRATYGKGLAINDRSPAHSNAAAPIMPEDTEGGAPIVWGWRANGPSSAFSNPGASDVLTHTRRNATNLVVVSDGDYNEIGARAAEKCLVDFEVSVRAEKRGGWYGARGELTHDAILVGREAASRWFYISNLAGHPPALGNGSGGAGDGVFSVAPLVEHLFPGLSQPFQPTDQAVAERLFAGGHVPQGPYDGDWSVQVGVTMSYHMALGYPFWRTLLADWIDRDGRLISAV